MNDIKFAHFAITDVGAHIFHCDSRTSRGAYGEAGFGEDSKLAWIYFLMGTIDSQQQVRIMQSVWD